MRLVGDGRDCVASSRLLVGSPVRPSELAHKHLRWGGAALGTSSEHCVAATPRQLNWTLARAAPGDHGSSPGCPPCAARQDFHHWVLSLLALSSPRWGVL